MKIPPNSERFGTKLSLKRNSAEFLRGCHKLKMRCIFNKQATGFRFDLRHSGAIFASFVRQIFSLAGFGMHFFLIESYAK